jgi:cytochrome oxidase Cu insertion factor (SCO1/SenC/PrrC family)
MEAGSGLHDKAREPGDVIAARGDEVRGRAIGRPGGKRERVGTAQIAVVVLAAVLIGVGAGVGAHLLLARSSPSTSAAAPAAALHGEATWPAGVRPAPVISTLHDQSGRRFSLTSLRGRTVAMVFFDSHCRQECPLAGRALASAEASLAPRQRPVVVVVSVNPRDTPASTRAAARAWGLAQIAPWHWLRGSHAQLAQVWRAYGIYVKPERGDISHTEALYLIDRRGYERSAYLYPYIPGFVSHDLLTLASLRPSRASGLA